LTSFQVSDRVWFWDGASRTVTGTVHAIARLADGTQLVVIRRDQGGEVSLPADTVTRISWVEG
ncbi:uncharacterized protein SCHCODRAFT_02516581, partial [Schizophyllum commune H4-8]|uniref:uncharacterized protein n=1 Tax=Schizophyllum commune (strain H4-8 / FGSC 9210) TaxID=578458 RepID=UPI00215EC4FD